MRATVAYLTSGRCTYLALAWDSIFSSETASVARQGCSAEFRVFDAQLCEDRRLATGAAWVSSGWIGSVRVD